MRTEPSISQVNALGVGAEKACQRVAPAITLFPREGKRELL
jgi:hypothetical protein